MNAREVANEFAKYLRQRKVHDQICTSCGYSQGHPLTYCPKCPGKMKTITYSEFRHFMQLKHPERSLWYKNLCSGLIGRARLSAVEWQAIVQEMRELDTRVK